MSASASIAPSTAAGAERSHWGAIFAMTLCAFALVSSEFMPVSLLTPLAADLRVTEGAAGQGIAMSGAFAVLTSLAIPSVARHMNRKTLLLLMTAMMIASGVVVSLASSYPAYMAGRAFVGVSIGGFWSLSAAAAIRLVPKKDVTRALAVFNGGNALAMVVAPPMGSFIGSVAGWRGAFFFLVPITLVALAWQWVTLPDMRAEPSAGRAASAIGLLSSPPVMLGMAAVSLFFMGQFALFTYLRPFLENVTGVGIPALSLILLAIGVAGFVGTLLIGRLLAANFYLTLTAIPAVMAVIAMALALFGTHAAVVVALLAAWGLVATAAPVGWWSWVAQTVPENAEAGGGLMVAVVQLAIGLGSTIGGVLYDRVGFQGAFFASAGILLVASALAHFSLSFRAHRQLDEDTPSGATGEAETSSR